MTWFGFSAPGAAALLSLIVPLVLFYFLKLKRPHLQIPSLVLWRQVLNDNRVNSPFQHFKRNLLLLLQLILLILLILAAMQPYWYGEASNVQRLPILIDRSASMSARNKPGSMSRLDVTKKTVRDMVSRLGTDQELALIAFGQTARQITGFSSNKRVLVEALDKIKIEHVASDLTDALRMANAMARSTTLDRVLLLSDGNFQEKVHFSLPFQIDFQRLPPGGRNMGITALNARRGDTGSWSVFVHVQSNADTPQSAMIKLLQDGQNRDQQQILIQKGRGERLSYLIQTEQHTSIEVRLIPDGFDSLACDNRALIELAPVRPLRIYVPTSLPTYRHGLRVQKNLQLFPAAGTAVTPSHYDLLITDKMDHPLAAAPVVLYVGVLPHDLAKFVTVTKEGTTVVDWYRESPLLEHVELGAELLLLDRPTLKPGADIRDLENLRYEVLAHGRQGPLILQKRKGHKQWFFTLFHTDRSDFPYRVGFPIMTSNLVRIAMLAAGLLEVQGNRANVLPALDLQPRVTYQIHGPDNYQRQETADEYGILSGIPAPRIGQYIVQEGSSKKKRVGINLLEPSETLLTTVDRINFEELTVTKATSVTKMNRPLWPILTTIGLLVLLAEWWLFHRCSEN